ncbi:hypothetical protein [Solitalea lacus]|uniref:hypothetical protein n=1 Tax=Solitalea lacus TaxID=2911172 RepID=UPI001EDBE350|nr:hypothetical protein [Solitalea lacus]UKJ09234.1 hypothetical protein L2B55_08765 [Solitalea lacus]
MNQKNFEYLKEQVKFSGFGEGLESELKMNLEKQMPSFELKHQAAYGKDEVSATLHFRRSEQNDMYFFNKYDIELKQLGAGNALCQTFYLAKDHTITLKEAYNLMSGRSINKDLNNKDGMLYNAWLQLDFKQTDDKGNFKIKQFHQNYGFDLTKELDKHLIKELGTEQDKTRLIESLNRGNRQMVTFMYESGEQKRFIEASPQFKSINIYDSNLRRVGLREVAGEKEGQSDSIQKEAKKANQKQSDLDDEQETIKESNKRIRSKGHSIH